MRVAKARLTPSIAFWSCRARAHGDIGAASSTTDTNGRFTFTQAPTLAGRTGEAGDVNYSLVALSGGQTLRWSFSVTPDSSRVRQSTKNIRFDFGPDPGIGDQDDLPTTWDMSGSPTAIDHASSRLTHNGLLPQTPSAMGASSTTEAAELIAADAGQAAATSLLGCSIIYVPTSTYKYAVNEHFADAWSWTGAKVTFELSQTNTHTVGLGFKATNGQWSQSGTTSFTETQSSGASKPGLWNNYVASQVNYRKYTVMQVCDGFYTTLGDEWHPHSVSAFLYPVLTWNPIDVRYGYGCVQYGGGATTWKIAGTNKTFGGGVEFGPISLSAKAGWDASVKMLYTFTSTSWYCGSDPVGPPSSKQVEAHKT